MELLHRLLHGCRVGGSSSNRLVVPQKAEDTGSDAACGKTPMHWNIARHPSQIPSAINLPAQVFGQQAENGCSDRPDVLPFPTYAACRFLDTTPDNPENGAIFEALRTMSASYLRADTAAICDCIQAFALNDLLFSIARLERLFKQRSCNGGCAAAVDALLCADGCTAMAEGAGGAQASHVRLNELSAVREIVGALMHEIECILNEYLSFNWDRLDAVLAASMHLLRPDGLACPWKSAPSLESLPGSLARQQPLGVSPHSTSDLPSLGSMGDSDALGYPGSASGSARHTPAGSTAGSAHGGRAYLGAGSLDSTASDGTGADIESFEEYVAARRNRNSGRWRADRTDEASTSSGSAGAHIRSMSVPGGNARGGGARRARSQARAVLNWRRARLAVTRKITTDMLGVQRRFQTLYEMFEDLSAGRRDPRAPEGRLPVLLLLGGGMAAGKSTVREIIGHDDFWSKVGKDAVVVEADAIKNRDTVYRALTSMERSMDKLSDAESLSSYVHEYSTKAAEAQLVAAVNQQKDIVFDGTMTWAPFVKQTLAMVRDHRHTYRRGPGYTTDDAGHTVELYWEVDDSQPPATAKLPYRIELVGVTCDPGLAVARGIWRRIRTGRGVPIHLQLRSHRLFSENFDEFAHLVDCATLYHTGAALTTFNKGNVNLSPKIIAHRSSATRHEMLVNPPAYEQFRHKQHINDHASCRRTLFTREGAAEQNVPTSDEESMSILRQVFRAADQRERQQRRQNGSPSAPAAHILL
ncbi:hypothetical protein WJX81_000145 [Elliptochloris bilobata]|uniref:Zeta toxin domain-containing protein n=1 Tax=Elliptochloris bilobata TaxID=381761 RepID=A0AAW1RFI0_9CHLO